MNEEIKKLQKELKAMTADRDSSIKMYQCFLEQSQKRGKALDILVPLIKSDALVDTLAELFDAKKEVDCLKGQKKYLLWQKDNPGKGVCEYIWSLN